MYKRALRILMYFPAVGCERAPPPATTSRRTTTTTTEAPQVYLHGHPYVVIKLHEVKGTRRVPSHRFSPPAALPAVPARRRNVPEQDTPDTERLIASARTPRILAARWLARSG
ncbi:hypothetical protein MRX96_056053 [Rhipicephalus microplus]